MALQDDTQFFEQFMAEQGRQWELDDRPWLDEQALMDRQTQLYAAGLDWLNDNYANTGYPAWMVGRAGGTNLTDTSIYNPGSPNFGGKGGRYWGADGNLHNPDGSIVPPEEYGQSGGNSGGGPPTPGSDQNGNPLPEGTYLSGLGYADGQGGYYDFDGNHHAGGGI